MVSLYCSALLAAVYPDSGNHKSGSANQLTALVQFEAGSECASWGFIGE